MTAAPVERRSGEGRGGSIYDLGYRGYEGPRLGRRAAIWSLLAHSVRTAYGIGRNARSKVMPVGLAVLAAKRRREGAEQVLGEAPGKIRSQMGRTLRRAPGERDPLAQGHLGDPLDELLLGMAANGRRRPRLPPELQE